MPVLHHYIAFKVLKVQLCSYQFFHFLLFHISFYISRYHFLQLFRASFNIWKKRFCHEFFFFNEFTQIPSPPPPTHPINGQNPLSMAKVFSWHSLKRLQANNKLANAWMNRPPPPLATACDRRRSILRPSSSKTNSETSKNIKVTSESSQLTLVLVDTSDGQLEMIH